MNKYLAAFVFVAVISFVSCDTSDDLLEKVKSKHLKSFLKENKGSVNSGLEKLEGQCPGVARILDDAVKSFVECDDKVDDSLTICESIQSAGLNCTTPLLNVVEGCLPQKAKGLATLGFKSLLSVAEFLCKQKGESLFELFNPCIWADPDESNEEISKCVQQLQEGIKKLAKGPPSPSETCTALIGWRSCAALTDCKNAKTKAAFMGLYDAITAPCSTINQV